MTESLALFNTATAKKSIFKPIDESNVRVYVCGPTVYDDIHIGNGRAMVAFDLFVRVLREVYPKVTFVRNITDVDDKIIIRAKERGIKNDELVAEMTDRFHSVTEDFLNCKKPDHEPYATSHIDGMIKMIETLIKSGHAYTIARSTEDGAIEDSEEVLFAVDSFADYGKLARKDLSELIEGARVEADEKKRNAADFVMWKPSKKGEPFWDSPWGKGRPGWHIECSVISTSILGESFDIHGGGNDLIFPHHQNELAQSCSAHPDSCYANVWMHNGMVDVKGKKMSKSEGNFLKVCDITEKYSGSAVRLALLVGHYRQPLEINEDSLVSASSRVARWQRALQYADKKLDNQALQNRKDDPIFNALLDDLDTPKALSLIAELVDQIFIEKDSATKSKLANRLASQVSLLGIELDANPLDANDDLKQFIDSNISLRNNLRKEKKFEEADKVRKILLEKNIILDDSPQGTTWRQLK